MFQVSGAEERRLSVADGFHQSFGRLRHLLHLQVVQQPPLLLTGYICRGEDREQGQGGPGGAWRSLEEPGRLRRDTANQHSLCFEDLGVMENSLLSFMAIFLPAISSYMDDKYSSGRSLLSLMPRFILMYCSFVILFFTCRNGEDREKIVQRGKHIFCVLEKSQILLMGLNALLIVARSWKNRNEIFNLLMFHEVIMSDNCFHE